MVIDINEALMLTTQAASIAALLSAIQVLVRRQDFSIGGALDCRLTALKPNQWFILDKLLLPRYSKLGSRLANVTTLVGITQAVTSVLLFCLPRGIAMLLVLFCCLLASQPLLRAGLDTADDFLRVLVAALLIHSIAANDRLSDAACVIFIAAITCLAYCTAGLSKAQSRMWWSGRGLQGIIGTQYFGLRRLRGVNILGVTKSLSWSVMLWEVFFPLILIAPLPIVYCGLAMGLLFHLAVAVVMGLDGFFWTFLASYPCVYSANLIIISGAPRECRVWIAVCLTIVGVAWLANWHGREYSAASKPV